MDEKKRQQLNKSLWKPKDKRRSNMKRHFKAMQTIMSNNADMRSKYWKIETCSVYRPCNQSECLHCGAGVPFREYPKKQNHLLEHESNDYLRGKSRNFRATAGHGVSGVFDEYEEGDVYAVTVGIYFGTKDMDCMQLNRSFRRRFKKFMKKRMPNAAVYLVADIATESTATFALDWPEADKDFEVSDPVIKAGLYLHAHGFIGDHTLRENRLRRVLKEFFVGARRVEIAPPLEVKIDEKGRVGGGYEGYAEYAAMEKNDLDQPDDDPEFDNVAMFEAMKRCRMAWPRNARKTKINHRSDTSKDMHSSEAVLKPSDVDTPSLYVGEMNLPAPLFSGYKWSGMVNWGKPLLFKDVIPVLESNFFGIEEEISFSAVQSKFNRSIR